jgi:hypothetical protein
MGTAAATQERDMERPVKFEHHRYVGDKRTQVVYDIDEIGPEDEHLIEDLMAAETFLCFGPDTVAEARNRGYKLFAKQRATSDA